MGIEPTLPAWEAGALPLCYARLRCQVFSPVWLANQARFALAHWCGVLVDSVGMIQTGTVHVAETKSQVALEPPWNVVVYNDPINLMSYVTLVFQRVFGYPRAKAEKLMLEVHHQGRSLVWSGGREPAEHYVHQLHSYQLLARLEQAAS